MSDYNSARINAYHRNGPARTVALASSVLAAIGCIGPWVTFFGIGINGTSVTAGKLSLLLTMLSSALLAAVYFGRQRRERLLVGISISCMVIAAIIAIASWSDLEGVAGGDSIFGAVVQVGWGLVLTTIGSVAGAGSAVFGLRQKTFVEPRGTSEDGELITTEESSQHP